MKKHCSIFLFSLLLALTLSFTITETKAQGCVMCRAQVGEMKDKSEAKLVGASLNTGILYLMSIPYILIGTVGFLWYRNSRRKTA